MTRARASRLALGALLVASAAGCGDRYPAAVLASAAPPTVRVLLGRERAEGRVHVAEGGWEAVGEGGATLRGRPGEGLDAVVSLAAGGIAVGGRDTGARVLRLRTPRTFELDGTPYAGTLVVRREGGRLLFVNELDLETYVAGVIANELAPGATGASFRAQAVAARTYAWTKLNDASLASAPFHVYDGARSQVYRGLAVPDVFEGAVGVEDLFRHAAQTRGVILTWQGRPLRAWYASTCGGHTTDPWTGLQEPDVSPEPLRGVPCRFCGTSPRFAWTTEVSDDELVAGFAREKRPVSLPIHALEVTEEGRGGWVRWLRVTYGPRRETKDLPGSVFRTVARLHSHRIAKIARTPGGWRIEGGGWGHGVGMCQWGAIEMGKQGFTETDILRYYYPGVTFTRVY